MKDPIAVGKRNWRILLLVMLLGASLYFIFVPGAPIGTDLGDDDPEVELEGVDNETLDGTAVPGVEDRMTNLQFGIELGGGASIRAPVHGFTAEGIGLGNTVSEDEVRDEIVTRMNVSQADVNFYEETEDGDGPQDAVEVTAPGDQEVFEESLEAAGVDTDEADIDRGVFNPTRQEIITVLDARLGETGLGGGDVTQSRTGEPRIIVEAPGQSIEQLEALIEERGVVEQRIHFPTENGSDTETVLRQDDIDDVSPVESDDQLWRVPLTLTDDGATSFVNALNEERPTGDSFAEGVRGNDDCLNPENPGENDWCLQTVVDDEVIWTGGMDTGLADSINRERGGDTFSDNPQFFMTSTDRSDAQNLRLNLIAGELPAQLDLDRANDFYFSPALAEDFRTNSLLVGLFAIIAVVMMVFLRYGDPRVAVPMSATAISEIVILLGFAAAIGMSLDLAEVAGFIVVVGTGVDDLIIIADEVMSDGEVRSHKVFDSRFRKAFWIIGAAAATTIIAMSPLAILDLGDLRGFAIITIIGVMIGVTITRPAYGNILRILKTEGR